MGYMSNHAILVSDHGYGEGITQAHTKAQEIFPWVSEISPPTTNSLRSFFIPPDGSKEGWDESDTGDARRTEFLDWLSGTSAYGDGTFSLSWAEVQYGDDEGIAEVIRHTDEAAVKS